MCQFAMHGGCFPIREADEKVNEWAEWFVIASWVISAVGIAWGIGSIVWFTRNAKTVAREIQGMKRATNLPPCQGPHCTSWGVGCTGR